MAATIVYDGVASGNPGSLFGNLKFWIAQRVPARNDLIGKIESNGGEVVKLEKQADMLIADHARKDVPAGSYSWKFVLQSIQNGRLEDKELHLIGRPAGAARTAGSAQPTKGTRRAFTVEDDEILAAWVLQRKKVGDYLKGNAMYQALEEKHPHHTWQSWRDRWVKKLSFQHADMDVSEKDPSTPRGSAPQITKSRSSPQATKSPSKARQRQTSAGSKKNYFSEEEDQLLTRYVLQAIRNSQPVSGNRIYIDFAEEHPNHSYHSWRDRWVRHLSKRHGPEEDEDEVDDGEDLPRLPTTDRAQVSPRKGLPAMSLSVAEASKSPQGNRSSSMNLTVAEINERIRSDEIKRKTLSAARTIQRVWRGHRVRQRLLDVDDRLARFQAVTKGVLVRRVLGEDAEEDNGQPEGADVDDSRLPSTPSSRTNKEQFYIDLQDFKEVTGATMDWFPKVGGQTLHLWDLWQAATKERVVPEQRNWELIAESLGFDWVAEPKVTTELKTCFENNLGEFEVSMQEFDMEGDDKGDEEGEGRGEGVVEKQEGLEADEAPLVALVPEAQTPEDAAPSSPSRSVSLKRNFEMAMRTSGQNHPVGMPRKRAHVSRGIDIPSNPNDRTLASAPQQKLPGSSSPISRRVSDQKASLSSSPGTTELPAHARNQVAQVLEPETQDFRFDTQIQDELLDSQDSQDATPSQQLRRELAEVQPIPFALGKKLPQSGQTFAGLVSGGSGQRQSPFVADDPGEQAATSASVTATRHSLAPSLEQPGTQTLAPILHPPSLPARRATRSRPTHPPPVTRGKQPLSSVPERLAESRNSTPKQPPATQPARQPSYAEKSIHDEVERFMSMGYPRQIVVDALKATTLNTGRAGVVMESLMRGEGVPDNHEGVWTTRDDRSLALLDKFDPEQIVRTPQERKTKRVAEEEWKRLEHKHGLKRIEDRRKYLAEMARAS